MSEQFDDLLSGAADAATRAAREPGAAAARKRGRQRRNRQRVAASAVSLALVGVVGGVAAANLHGPNGVPTAPASTIRTSGPASTTPGPLGSSPSTAQPSSPPSVTGSTGSTASTGSTTTAKGLASPAPCGNADVKVEFGHGSTNGDYESTDVIFTNVSARTCTLQGYPGAAIVAGSTTVNATRELNEYMGDSHLSTLPLVTLAPQATASATLQWRLATPGQTCPYPTATGSIEVIAPNTTHLDILSTAAHLGQAGICSGFEIDPVIAGTSRPPA